MKDTSEVVDFAGLVPGTKNDNNGAALLVEALHKEFVVRDLLWDFRGGDGAVGHKRLLPAPVL